MDPQALLQQAMMNRGATPPAPPIQSPVSPPPVEAAAPPKTQEDIIVEALIKQLERLNKRTEMGM